MQMCLGIKKEVRCVFQMIKHCFERETHFSHLNHMTWDEEQMETLPFKKPTKKKNQYSGLAIMRGKSQL